jgi:hypothetical protein
MSPQSRDPVSLLSRVAIAEALTESGYPIKAKTLATMATRGGGPPYRKWSKVALYRWDDALQWAQARLTDPHVTTSARDVSAKNQKPQAAAAGGHQ